MRILYIGHYDEGSTSRMRGEILSRIFSPSEYFPINIDVPLKETSRLFRSIGWRFRIGPLISRINKWILQSTPSGHFDLVWIDKGVFIRPSVLGGLRQRCTTLVHFTPDPAFTYHRSILFYRALPLYDHCITTKSYELGAYKANGAKHVLLCTQGYDPGIHRPYHRFAEKEGVVFIGHREADREMIISRLLENNISVKLAGINWGSFAHKHRHNNHLQYHGDGVFGEAYARLLSGSLLGLGLLSRIVPELHTTRTFEIPACGTALVTEKNQSTGRILREGEVLLFKDANELVTKITDAMANREKLEQITAAGSKKVREGGYDYESILINLAGQIFPGMPASLNIKIGESV